MSPKSRIKFMAQSLLAGGLMFEAVGCPQAFGDALIAGALGFVEVGLAASLVESVDVSSIVDMLVEAANLTPAPGM